MPAKVNMYGKSNGDEPRLEAWVILGPLYANPIHPARHSQRNRTRSPRQVLREMKRRVENCQRRSARTELGRRRLFQIFGWHPAQGNDLEIERAVVDPVFLLALRQVVVYISRHDLRQSQRAEVLCPFVQSPTLDFDGQPAFGLGCLQPLQV